MIPLHGNLLVVLLIYHKILVHVLETCDLIWCVILHNAHPTIEVNSEVFLAHLFAQYFISYNGLN